MKQQFTDIAHLHPILKYKRIDRYILSKYLVTFLVSMALIIVIVITFDLSEKLDDFISHNAPPRAVIFDYYLNFIPGFVNTYSALFIFISVIFFTSKMAGNTEIIAILGSGISYNRLMRPFLHGSVIVAVIVFVMGNFVLPNSNQHLIDFDRTYINTRRDNFYNNIHFQSKVGTQVYAESYNVHTRSAQRFHMDIYDADRKMIERHTAESITYDTVSKLWRCFQYSHRTIDGTQETLTTKLFENVALDIQPEDFSLRPQPIETMNTPHLYDHIQHEKMRGSKNVIMAQIEFYQRLFTPLAIIIMTVIGVAVSSRKTRNGMGMHLAIGITLAFTFVFFMKVSTVFATNGNLPPFWAVILPQAIFAVIAVFMVRTAPK